MLVGLIRNSEPLMITMEHTKYLVKHKVGQQLNSTPQNFSLSTPFNTWLDKRNFKNPTWLTHVAHG